MRDAGLRLLIKREDLNHVTVSGNKWWKLKYNLQEAIQGKYDTVLTFGGAYSNHIYATAAAAHISNIKSIGIVRGELREPLNATLKFAKEHGMQIHYVSRSAYREKEVPTFLHELRKKFGNFFMIPEGGTNALALQGCKEFGSLIDSIPADYICMPIGTGGTMAGILKAITGRKSVLGFSVLKGGAALEHTVRQLAGNTEVDWKVITEYSFGGYGKRNNRVTSFIESFRDQTNIPLDFVYTGKMMSGIFDLIRKGFFAPGKTILAIHTGGLQGNSAADAHA